MYCSNCGNNNAEGSFCDICGAGLTADPIVVDPENVIETSECASASNPGKVLGIISMSVGILGLVTSACSLLWFISIPALIAALIMGIISIKQSKKAGCKNGFALAGIIVSSVGIGLWAIGLALYLIYMVSMVGLGVFGGLASAMSGY